jgi:dienelactone hydrolase
MTSIGCCSGTIDKGEPEGRVENFHNLDCYITGPSSKVALVIATDVYGYKVPNVRLIADSYAKALGCTVYIPDYLHGQAMSVDAILPDNPDASYVEKATGIVKAMFEFPLFLFRHRPEQGKKVIRDFVRHIRNLGAETVFLQGYCWGGTIVLQLASENIADGVCSAHPGQIAVPNDFLALQTPIMFAFAENDLFLAKDIARLAEVHLKDKAMKCVVKQYAGTIHGFAVRGNSADPIVLKQRNLVLQDAIDFFRSFLK